MPVILCSNLTSQMSYQTSVGIYSLYYCHNLEEVALVHQNIDRKEIGSCMLKRMTIGVCGESLVPRCIFRQNWSKQQTIELPQLVPWGNKFLIENGVPKKRSTKPSFAMVFMNSEVFFKSFLAFVPFQDLYAMFCINSYFQKQVKSFLQRRIEQTLGHWFSYDYFVMKFMEILKNTRSAIRGMVANYIMSEKHRMPEQELGIATPSGQLPTWIGALIRWGYGAPVVENILDYQRGDRCPATKWTFVSSEVQFLFLMYVFMAEYLTGHRHHHCLVRKLGRQLYFCHPE